MVIPTYQSTKATILSLLGVSGSQMRDYHRIVFVLQTLMAMAGQTTAPLLITEISAAGEMVVRVSVLSSRFTGARL